MTDIKTILVTGIAGYWGQKVAVRLIAENQWRVLGLDIEPPKKAIDGLDFIQADIRNPLLVDLLKTENVDCLVHLTFIDTVRPSESAFDVNVIGTMKVLGACAEAGVRKVILKSSTSVYGARPTNPAFLSEGSPLNGSRAYGYTRDIVEIEAFCNGFRRQAPQVDLTILRFANIIGPQVETPMTSFLKNPLTPILLGFDPMTQMIHEADVVEVLAHAVASHSSGVFNIGADIPMPLTRLMALAGKAAVPVVHLMAYWGLSMFGGTGLRLMQYVPIELDYIRYPWVADTARMKSVLDFTPHYTAEEALREFAGQQRICQYLPEAMALALDQERLRDTIERRLRLRSRQQPVEEI